ncbi:hypothetical protein NUSPORA_02099 [Nucleospora cyclopteri]
MLLQLKTQFEKDRHRSIRRTTILSVKKNKSSHLAFIFPYLSNKYNIGHLEIELSILMDAQKKYLYNKIKEKFLYLKFNKCAENPLVDCKVSSILLKKGNIKACNEAVLCPFKTGTCCMEIKVIVPTINQQ